MTPDERAREIARELSQPLTREEQVADAIRVVQAQG